MKRIYVVIDFDSRIDEYQKRVLISDYYTVGMLMFKIRQKWLLDLHETEAMFLMFNDTSKHGYILQPVTKTLAEIQRDFGNPAVINISVRLENAFG